jgi:AcrR family transcriptional regulator
MAAIEVPLSRRERKKNATREAIHDAALSLTEELGLAAVTVEAIALRADVAPRTFFNHFPSKVHAVLGRDPDRIARVQQALASRPADEPPLQVLRHVLLEVFLPPEESRERIRRRYRVIRAEPTLRAAIPSELEEVEAAMVGAIAARTGCSPDRDLYPSLVVEAAMGAMRTAVMRWCEGSVRGPLEPVVAEAFDHLEDGLVPPSAVGRP